MFFCCENISETSGGSLGLETNFWGVLFCFGFLLFVCLFVLVFNFFFQCKIKIFLGATMNVLIQIRKDVGSLVSERRKG